MNEINSLIFEINVTSIYINYLCTNENRIQPVTANNIADAGRYEVLNADQSF